MTTDAVDFTPARTPLDSVASILEQMSEIDVQDLLNPRHYNLRGMQILSEAHELQEGFDCVFSTTRSVRQQSESAISA